MNEELLELSLIDSFRNHPFLVQEDESLFELMDSIKKNGLINPLIVRKKENRYGNIHIMRNHWNPSCAYSCPINKTKAVVL